MKRDVASRSVVLVLMVLAAAVFVIDWNALTGPGSQRQTDDAMLQGDPVQLATRAEGNLISVPVQDYSLVRAGDLLFGIDDSEYRARREQAAAGVDGAVAGVAAGSAALALQIAQLGVETANLHAAEAEQERARLERARQSRLINTESFLQRNWQDAVAADGRAAATVDGDRRALNAAQARVGQMRADLQGRRASLAAERAALALAEVELGYTRIKAPFDAIVTARLARFGEYVAPGRALITLVPLQGAWVVANFREVQLTHVHPGQAAEVRVDALPGVRLRGHVDSLQPASQANGSLLPPSRATGNFTKVIQRVPVKIVLDPLPDLAARLRYGLSAEAWIDTSGAAGDGR